MDDYGDCLRGMIAELCAREQDLDLLDLIYRLLLQNQVNRT